MVGIISADPSAFVQAHDDRNSRRQTDARGRRFGGLVVERGDKQSRHSDQRREHHAGLVDAVAAADRFVRRGDKQSRDDGGVVFARRMRRYPGVARLYGLFVYCFLRTLESPMLHE